jgi:cytochrome c-type biogenesis protein CcmH/NrfG
VVLVAAVFWQVPQLGWVDFDDTANVTENPRFFPVTWSGLTAFWLAPYENLYIPVSYMVFALEAVTDRWLAGADPAGPLRPQLFHAVSLAIHAFSCVLVWHLLRLGGFSDVSAGIGAAVFATHPLQVESVAWVSEQRGLLSAASSLLAIRDVIRGHRINDGRSERWFVSGTIWFCLALLAKPSAVTVPVIAWLMASATARPTRQLNAWVGAWLCIAALAVMVTRVVQPHGLSQEEISPAARMLVTADALWFYAVKLIRPVELCATYGRTPTDVLNDPLAAWRAGVVYGVIGAVSCMQLFRPLRRPVLLCFVPLLPVIGLVPFVYQNQSIVADRYAYLSVVGVSWIVAAMAELKLPARMNHLTTLLRVAFTMLAIAGIVGAAFLSHRQVECWRDTGALARQAVAVNPANIGGWTMLAAHDVEQGKPAEARGHALKALARAPENTVALFVLFEACTQLGDDGGAHAARQRLEQLGNSSTRMADAFFFRGVSHLASRRFERSCDNFRLAVSLKPDHEWAIINLGVVLTRMDRPQEAIAILTEHTITEPNRAAVWVGLGNALLTAGNAKTAVACYTRALELEANDPAVLANRAIAKEKTGDMAGAQEDRRRAAGITE